MDTVYMLHVIMVSMSHNWQEQEANLVGLFMFL